MRQKYSQNRSECNRSYFLGWQCFHIYKIALFEPKNIISDEWWNRNLKPGCFTPCAMCIWSQWAKYGKIDKAKAQTYAQDVCGWWWMWVNCIQISEKYSSYLVYLWFAIYSISDSFAKVNFQFAITPLVWVHEKYSYSFNIYSFITPCAQLGHPSTIWLRTFRTQIYARASY